MAPFHYIIVIISIADDSVLHVGLSLQFYMYQFSVYLFSFACISSTCISSNDKASIILHMNTNDFGGIIPQLFYF